MLLLELFLNVNWLIEVLNQGRVQGHTNKDVHFNVWSITLSFSRLSQTRGVQKKITYINLQNNAHALNHLLITNKTKSNYQKSRRSNGMRLFAFFTDFGVANQIDQFG